MQSIIEKELENIYSTSLNGIKLQVRTTCKSLFFILLYLSGCSVVYSQALDWAWANSSGDSQIQKGFAVAVDSSNGFLYQAGIMDGSAVFGSTTLNSNGKENVFLVKYTLAGSPIWAKNYLSSDDATVSDLVIGPSGSIYLTGTFKNPITFTSVGAGPSITINTNGNEDAYMVKFDELGDVVWGEAFGANGKDDGFGLCVYDSSLYITGEFHFTVTYQSLPSITTANESDAFLLKVDTTDGSGIWLRSTSCADDAYGKEIVADGSGVYLSGSYDNSSLNIAGLPALPNQGGFDFFVAKYDHNGFPIWSNRGGGNQADYALGMTLKNSSLYLTGSFENNFTLFHTSLNISLSSLGLSDIFIASYDIVTGDPDWALREGGVGADQGTSLDNDNNGDIILACSFENTFNFGGIDLVTALNQDLAIARYSPIGVYQNVQTATGNAEQIPNDIDVYQSEVYVTGYYGSASTFGSHNLPYGGNLDVFFAQTGCPTSSTYPNLAGLDTTVCTDALNLYATNPSGWTGTWAVIFGSVTLGNVNDPATLASNLSVGQNSLEWRSANATCTITDTIEITYILPPLAEAGNDTSLCGISTLMLNGSNPGTGTGLWTVVSGQGNFAVNTDFNTNVSGLGTGVNELAWTVTEGACSTSDTIQIEVFPPPLPNDAGPAQSLCDAFSTILAGSNPGAGSGLWQDKYGSATFSNLAIPNPIVSGLAYGTNTLIWEITASNCSVLDSVIITVDSLPVSIYAGPNQALCNSITTVLNGSDTTGGSGIWTVITGASTVNDPNDSTSIVSGLVSGTHTFSWSVTVGTCQSSDTVIVEVIPPVFAAFPGPPQTLCDSFNTVLGASNPLTGIGSWSLGSGYAVFTNVLDPLTSVDSLAIGQNELIWTTTNGPCSESDTVVITTMVPTIFANAGLDLSICGLSMDSLNGSDTTGASGLWSTIGGSGVFANPADSNSAISGLSLGINTLVWTISEGVCSNSDTVVVTATASLAPPVAGLDQSLCNTITTTLAASPPLIGSGSWSLGSGYAVFNNVLNPSTSVGSLANGQNELIWTVTNGPCSVSDTVVIALGLPTSFANAGPDSSICGLSLDNLLGSDTTGGSGLWTIISGSGVFANPADSNSGISSLSPGANSLEWTISNGACSHSDTVVITATDSLVPSEAGMDQALCNTYTATMAATPIVVGTGTWTVGTGMASFNSINDPLSAVFSLDPGGNLLVWTVTNGPCSTMDTVLIEVTPAISPANAGPDQDLCGVGPALLAGSNPLPGTGIWAFTTGSGNLSNSTDSNATLTGLTIGTSVLEWTITEGACSSTDLVSITIFDSVTPPVAGTDQFLCNSAGFQLNGNSPISGIGEWELLTGIGIVADSSDPFSMVFNLGNGSNEFTWTITNGACVAVDTLLLDHSSSNIQADAGIDQTACFNSMVQLNALNPSSGSGLWSFLSGSGNISSPSNPLSTLSGLSLGSNSLQWQVTDGNCQFSDTINIEISTLPFAPSAGPDQDICIGNVAQMDGNSPGSTNGLWQLISGTGVPGVAGDSASSITGLGIGNNSFSWTFSQGGCSLSDTVVIHVDDLADSANAGMDQELCAANQSSLSGNPAISGTGIWTNLGSSNLDQPGLATSTISNLDPGPEVFVWTISNGACPPSSDSVLIYNYSLNGLFAGPDQTLCEEDSAWLTAGSFMGSGNWSDLGGNALFSFPDSNISQVLNLLNGPNELVLEVVNGACKEQDTIVITNSVNPSLANAGADQNLNGNSSNLAAIEPIIGIGHWIFISGSGQLEDSTFAQSGLTNLEPGLSQLAWVVENGACPSDTDFVTITVSELFIPNGFSPNGDGKNEFWVIRGLPSGEQASVAIFNRWGNLIFESEDYQNDWDGGGSSTGAIADDTYYYTLNLSDGIKYKGFVVLKR